MNRLKQLLPDSLRHSIYNLKMSYRQVNYQSRVLPSLIIIGAQKSGTTSLFHYLSQHPQIYPSYTKEVHFFDGGVDPKVDNFAKGEAWYRAHFPTKRKLPIGSIAIEASPLYLFNPLVPKRMFDLVPNAKLIALLRNPTERAISHYFHVKRRGLEDLPMLDALNAEEERMEAILEQQDYNNPSYIRHTYKMRGRYKEQLDRFRAFFPWDQILVLNSDELFNNPLATLRKIYQFISVDEAFQVPDLAPKHTGTNKSKVEPEVYAMLDEYFRPYNQQLYELIQDDYGW